MHHGDLSGFADVDRTPDPDAYLRLLDAVNSWPFFRDEQKPRSLELLAVQPGQHILDVGCGLGDVTRTLGGLVGPQGRVVGIDLSERLIAEARQRCDKTALPVEFRAGNAEQLDWPDGAFDASRADRVLMFMDHPHQAVREMVRVIKPGGRIVLGEFDVETVIVDSPYRALTRKLLNFWCDTIPNGWIGRQLPALFQDLGLQAVTVVPLTLRLTSYSMWSEVFQIEVTVRRAQQANVVSAAEASLWLRHLQDADRLGKFSLSLTLFLVAGQKG
ncbi:MAG: methyltransferase domain-containing protein [Gemmataceae bacterium]